MQGHGVEGKRGPVFLHSEEDAAPENNVGVGCGADDSFDHFVVCVRVSVAPEQGAPRARLRYEAICVHVALAEVDMAVFKAEGGYRAVAVEVDVFFEERRETVVRLDSVKSSVDVFGNLQLLRDGSACVVVDLQCR